MDRTRRIAELALERYPQAFGTDFDKNKEALAQLALVSSKQLRNHVAGHITKALKASSAKEESASEPKGE